MGADGGRRRRLPAWEADLLFLRLLIAVVALAAALASAWR